MLDSAYVLQAWLGYFCVCWPGETVLADVGGPPVSL